MRERTNWKAAYKKKEGQTRHDHLQSSFATTNYAYIVAGLPDGLSTSCRTRGRRSTAPQAHYILKLGRGQGASLPGAGRHTGAPAGAPTFTFAGPETWSNFLWSDSATLYGLIMDEWIGLK